MEFTKFVRKPFTVEAVKITKENIAELAEFIGTLAEEDGQVYIDVDRQKIPALYKVFPGFWFTKIGNSARCYSDRIFKESFTQSSDEIDGWVEKLSNITDVPEVVDAAT